MKITEVRIKLMEEPSERLKAFCSITFDDCFVIRDLKIIDGANGFFVAMPSRKLTSHCPVCRYKNPIRAAFCNQCGARLPIQNPMRDEEGRAKLYADIAHPINTTAREMIQREVIQAYEEEKVRAQSPGYVSRYDDYDLDYEQEDAEFEGRSAQRPAQVPPTQSVPPTPAATAAQTFAYTPPKPSLILDDAEPIRPPHRPAPEKEREDESSSENKGFGAGIFD
ncbi:MAG: SpoVG family protein [Planctomycetia bacterium]|nr:SpoVG family protein [Planctomycetia bacterium]